MSQRTLLNLFYIKFGKKGEALPFALNISISQFISITRRGVPDYLLGYFGSVPLCNIKRGPLNLNSYLQEGPQTVLQ